MSAEHAIFVLACQAFGEAMREIGESFKLPMDGIPSSTNRP